MDRPVVVPLDGSPRGEEALPLAVQVARTLGATLHLVRVHEPLPAPYSAIGDSREVVGAANRRIREAEYAYLAELASALTTDLGGLPARSVLLEGAVRETLVGYCRDQQAALIVAAPNLRRGLSRILSPSVSGYLVRKSPVPVLLARLDADEGGRPVPAGFRRVLAIAAGIDSAEALATHLDAIAPESEVTFVLFDPSLEVEPAGEAAASPPADDIGAVLRNSSGSDGRLGRYDLRVRGDGSPDEVLATEVPRTDPDLVAVAMGAAVGDGRRLRWRARSLMAAGRPVLILGPAYQTFTHDGGKT